jgi:hypothetical protein
MTAYIVEYTRKNGKSARKTIDANSFGEVSKKAQEIKDFSHICSVVVK